eukprot:CAMPEP_0181223840 /NCGR_PEP_ID=MMETSP1096-20121128/30774_1 /TAXON_ID=156174 ORGANISM="Chrysochromulina ericina, Strain CCMP281" /NCGR_SAMPLE_ID=MMETSP1096 /ASSEMBLY_ACC=CAM_ASM_000453 /LENGTH=93 /DNA_ID=CAMNT_0023316815 /DNA_START=540 /DNA_END=821 /DNA_ORIENTATION=-
MTPPSRVKPNCRGDNGASGSADGAPATDPSDCDGGSTLATMMGRRSTRHNGQYFERERHSAAHCLWKMCAAAHGSCTTSSPSEKSARHTEHSS